MDGYFCGIQNGYWDLLDYLIYLVLAKLKYSPKRMKNASFCARNARASTDEILSWMRTCGCWTEWKKCLLLDPGIDASLLISNGKKNAVCNRCIKHVCSVFAVHPTAFHAHIFTYWICEWLVRCNEWLWKLHTHTHIVTLAFTKLWRIN